MPRYRGSRGTAAAQDRPQVGVLVTNLGTPDEPSPAAVRRYLREFLWDPRVVELSRPLWWIILNVFVLTLRPRRVAKLYRSIWTAEGSPLLGLTRKLSAKIQLQLPSSLPIAVGMRYGNPSTASALAELVEQGCGRVVHLPLYPQYSASTSATNIDAVNAAAAEYRWVPEIRHVPSYHLHPAYVGALAESVRAARSGDSGERHLLMSFHGIPQRYADQGDPYPSYCQQTAEALAAELQLEPSQWSMTFQSRFGREPWLQPYTDHTLASWGREGPKRVDVICPGFAVDCLETLEEIEEQNREIFLSAGGEDFRYVPALNDSESHARICAQLIGEAAEGWASSDSLARP